MVRKFYRIFLVLFLIFIFCISYALASDINLDLPSNNANSVLTNEVQNNISNDSDILTSNPEFLNSQEEVANLENDIFSESLQPETVIAENESGLSTTNIINILVITIGVVLILLAIAIIIRLKN